MSSPVLAMQASPGQQRASSTVWDFVLKNDLITWAFVVLVVVAFGVIVYFVRRTLAEGRTVKVGPIKFGGKQKKPENAALAPASIQAPAVPTAPVLERRVSRTSRDFPAVPETDTDPETTKLLWLQASRVYELVRHRVPYRVHQMEFEYEFTEAYDLKQSVRMHLSASQIPIFALGFRRGSPNTPFSGFGPLKLRVRDGNARDLVYLPTCDSLTRKYFAVFLPTPLLPGAPAIELVIENEWPGAAHKLQQLNTSDTNDITFPAVVTEKLETAKLTVRLPENRHRFRLEIEDHDPVELPDARGNLVFVTQIGPLLPGDETRFTVQRLT